MSKNKQRRKKTLSRKQLEIALKQTMDNYTKLAQEVVELKAAMAHQNNTNLAQSMQDDLMESRLDLMNSRLDLVEKNSVTNATAINIMSDKLMIDGFEINGKALVEAIQRDATTLKVTKEGKLSSRERKVVLDLVSGKLHFK